MKALILAALWKLWYGMALIVLHPYAFLVCVIIVISIGKLLRAIGEVIADNARD